MKAIRFIALRPVSLNGIDFKVGKTITIDEKDALLFDGNVLNKALRRQITRAIETRKIGFTSDGDIPTQAKQNKAKVKEAKANNPAV